MTKHLRPYPEYQDSGLPWLGRIPAHWSIIRTKGLFRLSIEKSKVQHGMELLSVYTHIGVRPRKDLEQRGNKASTTDGYWIVRKGDLIVNKLLAWMGAVGVSHYEGVTSPAYDVLRPRRALNSDYYHYLFRTYEYLQQFKSRSRGIMDMRLRLYFDQLGQIPSLAPPQDEQNAIVAYLDKVFRKTNKFIRNRRQLIEVLKEQKQAIINQAVTRGLDPDAPLKPSGIGWFGNIPEHWEILPLKRGTELIAGGATPDTGRAENWGGNVVWITPTDVSKADVLTDSERHLTKAGLASCSSVVVPAGSIIITSRAPVGNTAIAAVPLCTNQGCKVVVPDPSRFLNSYLHAELSVMKPHLQSVATGTTFIEIDTWSIANEKVATPPLDEQHHIVATIRIQTRVIEKAINNAQREIDLIREYRTRLITDVVTGKVDVRGLASAEATTANDPTDEGVNDEEMLGDEEQEVVEETTDADD